jgi:cell division protein FtsQ
MVLDEKTARRLRRLRWRRIGIGVGVVAVIAGLFAMYMSPLLRVQRVEVVGVTTVSADEVASLAALEGDSMFRLDSEPAEDRIGYLPMVESVKLTRRWPQTVRVEVTERVAWGYWQVGADRYVIDSQGVVLPDVVPAEGAPTITDLSNPVRLVPGDHVDIDAVRLTQSLIQRVPAALSHNVTSLEYSPAQGLALTTDAGYRVVVGDSQNMDYKLAVWQAIEGELGREAMVGHVLDLRFEDRPSFQ